MSPCRVGVGVGGWWWGWWGGGCKGGPGSKGRGVGGCQHAARFSSAARQPGSSLSACSLAPPHQQPLGEEPGAEGLCRLGLPVAIQLRHLGDQPAADAGHAAGKAHQVAGAARRWGGGVAAAARRRRRGGGQANGGARRPQSSTSASGVAQSYAPLTCRCSRQTHFQSSVALRAGRLRPPHSLACPHNPAHTAGRSRHPSMEVFGCHAGGGPYCRRTATFRVAKPAWLQNLIYFRAWLAHPWHLPVTDSEGMVAGNCGGIVRQRFRRRLWPPACALTCI